MTLPSDAALLVPGLGLVVAAFLAGSVPFSLLLGLMKGVDIRTIGSGNPGATNLGRALGKQWFFAGFALDMLKGALPVAVAGIVMGTWGQWTSPSDRTWWVLACVIAAVLGHVFSPWLKFKGGKGVATGFGAVLGVYPMLTLAACGALVVFLLLFAAFRRISVGSIAGAAAIPVCVVLLAQRAPRDNSAAALSGSSAIYFWVTLGIALLVIVKHRANIQRLLAGTEPRFDKRS